MKIQGGMVQEEKKQPRAPPPTMRNLGSLWDPAAAVHTLPVWLRLCRVVFEIWFCF
jgi:hypothetical protein